MKWLSNRYAYPIVALVMLASVGLQVAWLGQLFRAQQVQVKRDLDQAVANAASQSDYLSVAKGHENSENFKNFFLSSDWLQIKQAFTRLRDRQFGGSFSSQIRPDSTIVTIGIHIANDKPRSGHRQIIRIYDEGETLQTIMAADKRDLARMDSLVKVECLRAQLDLDTYHVLYDYDSGKPKSPAIWKKAQQAAYRSQQHGYNLNFFLHTYQLVAQSINGVVLYRMRYYLGSSLLMLLSTGAAFFFLFRIMHSQRLYSQARLAFTSNMTHELKTPVSVIEAALDAITRYDLAQEPAKMNNYIQISQSELQRLNLMIDKVLSLDHLDNGQLSLRRELYDVQQGLTSVVSSMQLRQAQTATVIHYQPATEPCFVDGDPVHLTNVFYNLIDNALKYGGKNVRIAISCKCSLEKIHISFQDNGPGISVIYQERIFERFFRVPENPDVHNIKGSGLGLHYVKQIVEKHGGSVKLQSEARKGSTFTIILPAYHEV
ncbi:HAMP domain-containing histidine kinase [Dyadobacter sp. CY327]|uniref:sensor histidine kinase n=1 Tax=Dyadobacter sp. CY327 TaxID=2907301 RepID=UPI001F47A5D8|nr:HAMP domain-containing sensor histidine kinase [Dyadobacter sp. CY327]MCE7070140.1 HAMP domain-containing histidine kinase [Dyadobacter sp. CY327]